MNQRRRFLTYSSLAAALATSKSPEAWAAEPGGDSQAVSIPKVSDFSSLNRSLSSISIDDRRKFVDFLSKNNPRAAKCESNCGCNAVCNCNDNIKSCCENKCACHAKDKLTFDTGLIRNSPEFQELVKKFNPEEQRLFGEMASTWTKIPALADARFQGVKLEQLGISDRARGLEVGVFKSTQIESYFTIRDIKGRKISAEQLSKQRK